MKVLMLADASSVHTIKWVNALVQKDIELLVFSLKKYNAEDFISSNKLRIEVLGLNDAIFKSGEGAFGKLVYFKALPKVKKLIREFQPDLLHAHYISSYGTIGALCNFHPYIISVWGSDIYDFPQHNFLFKKIIEFDLQKADHILSTSQVMAQETAQYTSKSIQVTPFGVDTTKFQNKGHNETDEIVIGTVKTLDHKYGIDTLIDAFALLCIKHPDKKFKLKIAGTGSNETTYRAQVKKLKLEEKVDFSGRVPNDSVPEYISSFDVYLALSRLDSESFGVAIVEAMACEVPVVVSNVGGLPEVVKEGQTGYIIPKENAKAAVEAIEKIIFDKTVAQKLGKNGRERVLKYYDWPKNVSLMLEVYKEAAGQES